jgi:S-adenosylmethionine:diacylglycerol 3-amino-3-carboxypropyl transferase
MRGFWGTLNYSSVNEDWRTEATALRLRDGDRVLAITGGGGRVLDLLAVADVAVVGIDLDGPQNHLLWLKLEAMRRLAWPEYAAFLGLVAGEPRAGGDARFAPAAPAGGCACILVGERFAGARRRPVRRSFRALVPPRVPIGAPAASPPGR